jgi:adenosylcobinamide-phosphate guanylyltransferase
MAVAALVMAGGKATRMGAEKPLLHVGSKALIERVIDVLRQSESVDRIVVAVSPHTQETGIAANHLGVEVISTVGEGYESDMKQAIKALSLGNVLVVSADLPFLLPRVVDEAIERYLSSGKPALMVAAPVDLFKRNGMEPSYVFDLDGRKLAPVGVNIIDGKRVDEAELDESVYVVEFNGLVFNVNTPQDLEIARSRSEQAG